jgi:5-methylcytosine-specific restriction protein A
MRRSVKPSPQEWRTVPLPRGWAKIRKRILHRDPQCTLRTKCHGAVSEEVDHIDDPNDHSDRNLRGVCHTCHAHRTGQQGAAAANARRPSRRRPAPRHPGIT